MRFIDKWHIYFGGWHHWEALGRKMKTDRMVQNRPNGPLASLIFSLTAVHYGLLQKRLL